MNYPKRRIAIAIAMIGCATQPLIVHAEDTPSQLDRVEVVGSNIKRAATKQATQIEVYKTEEFTKQGITTTQEIVNALASNQSVTGSAQSVGAGTGGASYANLRGLGEQYTLVLIDGRRVANAPVSGSGYAVDLNTIPLAIIDKVEVLKDGASAIYGTDAIGGVINFVTKKNLQGVTVSTDYSTPEHSGGGTEKKVSIAGGIGDLNKNGWNLQGSLDASKQTALFAKDRSSIALDRQPYVSANTWPSNYLNSAGNFHNPAYPNCSNGTPVNDGQGDIYCTTNPNRWIALTPKVERVDITGKATKKLGDDHELSLQYIRSETTTTAYVAPTPLSGAITISPSSPYYPTTDADGTNSGALKLYGRTVEAGPRIDENNIVTQRLQGNLEGLIAGWDYKTGIGFSESVAKDTLKWGYVSSTLLQNAVNNGTINPFGTNSADQWSSLLVKGDLYKSTMQLTTGDFKVSKEVLELPAGNLALAFGVEARHEKLDNQIGSAAKDAMSSGFENSVSTKGQRNAGALYTEAIIPTFKNFETQVAARYDAYSDFGSTFNPKVAFKYTPTKELLFRGSGSTGFRAPTLYNMYQPSQTTWSESSHWWDLGWCPDGVTPVSGHNAACKKTQVLIQQGGNSSLKPEKSTSLSFGVVVEPIKPVTLSADLWQTTIQHQIGALDQTELLNSILTKYQSRIHYNADGSLAYIEDLDENLGTLRASGLDLAGSWQLPRSSAGNFSININSTYMIKYDYQNEVGGEYKHAVGNYVGNAPIFRWKYELAFNWNKGPLSATLSQSYHSGYQDLYTNADGSVHKVSGDSQWNISAGYDWHKTLDATIGIRNLFNRKPAYTNQDQVFQQGYDPRFSDIYGRTFFMNLTYKM